MSGRLILSTDINIRNMTSVSTLEQIRSDVVLNMIYIVLPFKHSWETKDVMFLSFRASLSVNRI